MNFKIWKSNSKTFYNSKKKKIKDVIMEMIRFWDTYVMIWV